MTDLNPMVCNEGLSVAEVSELQLLVIIYDTLHRADGIRSRRQHRKWYGAPLKLPVITIVYNNIEYYRQHYNKSYQSIKTEKLVKTCVGCRTYI